ncbi:9_t:CDS:1, partial [Gigaspora rosea]
MSEIKKCMECKTTKSRQFRSLAGNKWEEAEANGLIKATWVKGNKLCNTCYMNFVENQLRKAKRVKFSVEEVEASEVVAEPVANVAVGGVE